MPKYLDLFAGAGGLSEGFVRAGYEPVAHVEMDVAACYSLRTRAAYHWLKKENKISIYHKYLNNEISRSEFYEHVPKPVLESVLNYEISEETLPPIFSKIDAILDGKQLDLIVGGPPCQAYSIAGRSRSENKMVGDKRNYLYKLYAEFLKHYQPKYFVFENVVGLLSAKDEDGTMHLDNMRKLFNDYGYSTEFRTLNALDYGVLQNRRRIILIGKRGEHEGFYPKIPTVENAFKVDELFSDLPSIQSGEGVITPVKTNPYLGKYLYNSGIKEYDQEPVTFHQARPHTKQDLEIYRIIVESWNEKNVRISYTDLPERLRTHNNTKCFLDRFKVVAGNLSYAQTVVAHICRDGHYYIHPDIKQNRSLTPREAARIQTFPDNYYFESVTVKPSRTLAYKQIGNAVPVCLAHSVAKALLDRFVKDENND
ncbi:MAG: DNA cytosine methyltransferase [Clostridia bacterium]|nr:DNA cytosine methyltransferase [Clostridia bacterium]